jgi:putative type-1 restriction enzyme hindVIIP specificity protein
MSNWKEYRLGDCIEFIIDNRGKNPPLSNNGYELIETISINSENKYPDYSKISKFVSKDTYNNWFRKGHPKKGDILISTVGANIGRVSIMNENRGCIAQNLIGLRTDKEKLVPDYLYYFLIKKSTQHTLSSLNIGSAQPSIKVPHLLNILINVPNIQRQEEIANILSSLDNKIDLNTQINQTLEQIAQALFKSWFVDFDPVRAKVQALSDGLSLEQAELAAMQAISGKTPEELTALSQTQPDRYAELAETAKAFPCEMVEVDGVEVPKGWECFSLKELSSVISKGTTPKKSSLNSCDSKETVPFIKVKDISESGQILINQVEQIPEKISSTELKRSILHKNDILISIAGTIGRVAIVPNELENANTNQAISFIRLYNDNLVGIISTFLKSRKNQEDITSKVIQGVQANISLEVVRNIKIFLPINFDHKAILIFNSLLNKQLLSQKENLLIEKSRDLLLPKLLSGDFSNGKN